MLSGQNIPSSDSTFPELVGRCICLSLSRSLAEEKRSSCWPAQCCYLLYPLAMSNTLPHVFSARPLTIFAAPCIIYTLVPQRRHHASHHIVHSSFPQLKPSLVVPPRPRCQPNTRNPRWRSPLIDRCCNSWTPPLPYIF